MWAARPVLASSAISRLSTVPSKRRVGHSLTSAGARKKLTPRQRPRPPAAISILVFMPPELFARHRIEREHRIVGRAAVQGAVHHQGRAFVEMCRVLVLGQQSGVIGPSLLQIGGVGGRDLGEFRIARAVQRVAVMSPSPVPADTGAVSGMGAAVAARFSAENPITPAKPRMGSSKTASRRGPMTDDQKTAAATRRRPPDRPGAASAPNVGPTSHSDQTTVPRKTSQKSVTPERRRCNTSQAESRIRPPATA